MAVLEAEGEAETAGARQNAEAGWHMVGYRHGLKLRLADIQGRIDAIAVEEDGARDALSATFEDLKKYEQVDANAKAAARVEEGRREIAVLDEMGLRRGARR